MKQSYRALFVILMLAAILVSACGAAAVAPGAGAKVEADIIITGMIESIDGTQWVVNGQTFTVDPSLLRDGPFMVGDTVKVEGDVQADGSVVVTRVETPNADDVAPTASPTASLDDNSNDANTNANLNANANANDDNSNDDNANGNANTNDDDTDDSNGNANTNDDDVDDSNDNANSNDDSDEDSNSNDDNSNGG